jgi:hypothetical protein
LLEFINENYTTPARAKEKKKVSEIKTIVHVLEEMQST